MNNEILIWRGIKQRCFNSNNPKYKNYGGRGITICKRWLESFDNFIKDMGPRPSRKHSIDRKDNDGNYEPSNCRWATYKEQLNNTRRNKLLTHRGITRTMSEWADEYGINYNTLQQRLRVGWDIETALIEPVHGTRLITVDDVTKDIAGWHRETGLPISTLKKRCDLGWTDDEIINTPIRKVSPEVISLEVSSGQMRIFSDIKSTANILNLGNSAGVRRRVDGDNMKPHKGFIFLEHKEENVKRMIKEYRDNYK